jgi:ligand-binding SRPBCC domain-containing protein
MTSFAQCSLIDASLADVWEFHSHIEGLEALTPSWAGLRVDRLEVPGGGDLLVDGTEMDLSAGPLARGPRLQFTAKIVARERTEGHAQFVDEMIDGPLTSWRHTHRFEKRDGKTLLIDEIEYETGYGACVDRAFGVGLTIGFAGRHRKTREMLQ